MQRRLPRHIGFIPDGNRRWADARGLPRQAGYAAGIEPGLRLLERCGQLGIEEVSAYAFTKENVRRPGPQVQAFREATVTFALAAVDAGAALLVVGDAASSMFPTISGHHGTPRSGAHSIQPAPEQQLALGYDRPRRWP